MYPALRIPMQNTHLSAPYESSSLATPYSGGTMGAEQWRQFEFMAAAERKPYNRASPEENKPTSLCSWKCTPFGAAHHFPRRGKFALLSAFEFISISKHSAARISPSGGDVAAGDRRGAFPAGAGAVVWFSLPEAALPPQAAYILIARRAIPQPSAAKPLSNLRTLRPIGPVNPKNLPF